MKRFLSMALAIIMVIGMMPSVAFAAETENSKVVVQNTTPENTQENPQTIADGNVAKVGNTEYATLAEAFAAVTSDTDTITILCDVTENLTGAYLRGNIVAENDVTITLTNTDWVYCPYSFVIGENVTLKTPALFYYAGGAVIKGTVVTDAYYQRYAGTKLYVEGTMTVNGETFILRYTDGDGEAGIYVNGGTLNASVIYFYQGMISATNGTINVGTYWQTNETDGQGSANLVLDNSTLKVSVYDHPAKATGNSTVTLKNGSIMDCKNGGFTYGENAMISVYSSSKILGKGGEAVKLPVAQIGEQGYKSLAAALSAAKAGDTITFLADITEDVTISKSVTIDGAGKTYTGKMTLKADTTIKNVNFDGKGYNGYAVETRGANYLTIEDCTAKNYGYGFVQLPSATVLTTVKNVTISNMNYGVKVDYSGAVVLENCDITAGVAAVLNSNYGEKTITIKDSKLNILGTWTRNNTTKTNYVFEGANTIDSFITDAAIDNFKLAEGATLTAPEGITVTTDVQNAEVKYKGGKYYVSTGLVGSGTKADPYQIGSVEDLIKFRDSVNAGETKYSAYGVYVVLTADIDLAGINWVGIGSINQPHGFMGNFDGNGFTIKNLTITNPELDSDGYAYAGLFSITEGAAGKENVIKNLIIENVTISTTGHIVAAAIAYPYYTTVENVTVCGDINITGGDYTAAVLAYTRRCVNASNLTVSGNTGSTVTGGQVVGGVISDIQMNGGLKANYSNFSASGLTIKGEKMVGGISGIIATQALDGATVKNVTLVSGDSRVGIVAGAFGGTCTISNVTYENVTGATVIVGSTYDNGAVVQAKIGDTYYATLAEAFAAAKAGDTITLLSDVVTSAPIVIEKTITIDGNGKTLTYTGTDRAIEIPNTANGADVTVKNLKIVGEKANRGINYNTNGTLTVENVTVELNKSLDCYAINFPTSADGATVNVTDSKLTARIGLNIWGSDMDINVTDSEIYSVEDSTRYSFAAIQLNRDAYGNIAEGTVVTVTGGKISATDEDGDPSAAVSDWTSTGEVSISSTTEVIGEVKYAVAMVAGACSYTLQGAIDGVVKYGYTDPIVLIRNFEITEGVKIPENAKITIDLNGKTITGTDNITGSFGLINIAPGAELTINDTVGGGKITLTATNDRDWNAYSSVISNQRGKLTVNGGTIEHLGGTDMAYAIDNLTNGKGTYAETIINGGTIKSTYRAIRQFLNGIEAQNILTINGGTIEGANKAIFFHDPSKNANSGTLTVGANAVVNGDIYLFVTAGSTEWPVEVSIAASAVNGEVVTGNVPEGYVVEASNGVWGVREANYVAEANGVKYETLQAAVNAGGTVTFLVDIDEDVTISKKVTIDGNGKTYTGKMTLKADTTIKNVNFDGKGYNGYAVETRGANYLTIEDCTAKNYGYGFVQLVSATALTTVKNVTVSNMNYGVKVDYSGAVVLENVDITAGVAAVLNSNYGAKTITIKDSKLSILGTWTRNNTVKTTYVFEGANTVSEFIIDAAIDNFKLAADSTLTAPKEITVTTDVAGMKVEYENGTYKLVKAAIAKIGKVEYASLQEAVDAAKAGQTITLICDAEGPGVVINKSVNINFGGFTYTLTEGVGSTGTESNGIQLLKGNTVKLTNGTLKVAESAASKFYILIQNYGYLTVNGMTLDGTNLDKWSGSDGDSYVVSNNSGTFNANSQTKLIVNNDGDKAFAIDACDKSSWGYELPVVTVSAKNNIYVDKDTKATDPYQYIEAAAYRGNYFYATLQQAVNEGGTITLFRDVAGSGVVVSTDININFGGHTYTFTEGVGSTGTESNGFQILKGTNVVLRNGTLKVADSAANKFYILIQNYSDSLSLANMTLNGTNLDKWSKTDGDSYVLSNNSGNVSIDGQTTIIANDDGALAFAFDACDKSAWGYELPVVTVHKNAVINGNIEAAAKIGNVYYATLQQAIDDASNGKTITLMKNIEVDWNDVVMTADNLPVLFKVEGKKLTLDMNGKTISVDHQSTTDRLYAVIYVEADASLTVTGNGGIDVTTHADTPKVAYMFWKRGTTGTLVIENGTYHMNNSEDSMVYTNGDKIVTVKGGTWTLDKVGTRVNRFPCIFNASGNNTQGILVSGGTYNYDVSNQHWIFEVDIVDGKGNLGVIVNNGDGTWTVTGKTAEVGIVKVAEGYEHLTGYATFKDAVAAIGKGAPETTIKLLKNITVKGQFIGHSYAQKVVIDLNGYTMSSSDKTLTVYRAGTEVTIKNGTVHGNTTGGTVQVTYGGKLILGENVTITSGGQATAVKVDNGTLIIAEETVKVLGGKNDLVVATGANVQISAGYFKKPVDANWCAEGYVPTDKLDNGYYSVVVDPTIGKVAKIGDMYYETLQEAIKAAQNGDKIVLIDDMQLDTFNTVKVTDNYAVLFAVKEKSITIDLNGKNIVVNASAAQLADEVGSMLMAVFCVDTNGALTLTGEGSVTVNANDASVYSLAAVYGKGGSLEINGGKYTADEVVASGALIYAQYDDVITVNGGNFHLGNVGEGTNGSPWIFNAKGQNTANIIVKGGTFNADVFHQYWIFEVTADKELALRNNGDGTYTVVSAVAYVVEVHGKYTKKVGYATLQEAANVAEATGWELVVLNSETVSTADDLYWALYDGKVAVVEGELKYDDMIVAGGEGKEVTVFLNEGAELSKNAAGKPTFYAVSGGILNVAGNGTVITDNPADYTVFATNSGTAVINGGNFVMGDTTNKAQLYSQNSGTLVINDGTFISTDSNSPIIYCINGFVEINGGFFQNTANSKQALLGMGNNLNYINNQKITLRGGTFVNWNPMDSAFARPWTNPDVPALIVLAEGYTIVSETQANGDIWYTVVAE